MLGVKVNYSKRIIEIIEILLKQDDFIAVSEIADKLGISKRTIFRDLDEVESISQSLGMIMIRKTRFGIKLKATDVSVKRFKSLIKEHKIKEFTKEERENLITLELLKSNEQKKFYYFANMLGVSEATISYDMDRIQPWFEKREITLVRKPGYGVHLEGKEVQFRKAIVDFLYQNYEHKDLISLIENKEDVSNFVESVIDKETLLKVGEILKAFKAYLENRLTDGSFMGLMVHLAIATQRMQRGENIFMNPDMLEGLQKDAQYEVAKTIAQKIEIEFDIDFPPDELGYITMHLKGSKLKTGTFVDQSDIILTNYELSKLASAMISNFKIRSGFDLVKDEKLLIGLVSHLGPAVTRMKMGLDIRNPLLDNIREMYPEIYQMSLDTSKIIEASYQVIVPESEIGYIAMHFGASIERFKKNTSIERKIRTGIVCSSGFGTSSLLYSRVSKMFPKLELMGQYAKEDVMLNTIETDKIELLISTIEIEQSLYPVIQVNPLLMENDIEKIKQVIKVMNGRKSNDSLPLKKERSIESHQIKMIHHMTEALLMVEETFKLHLEVNAKTLQDLIKLIANELLSSGKDRKKLKIELNSRENIGSTVISEEKIVLIHTKTDTVTSLNLSVWRLVEPITNQSGEAIWVAVVMLVPSIASENHIKLMSQISKALIEDKRLIYHIKKSNEAMLAKYINDILHKWLGKQMKEGGLYDL